MKLPLKMARTGAYYLDLFAPLPPNPSTNLQISWGAPTEVTDGTIMPSDIQVARDGVVLFCTTEPSPRSGAATWGRSVRAAQTRRIHRAMRRRERRAAK